MPEPAGLREGCLSFMEVVAQSVANIAPTASPALIIPLVFASAGNGTWLAYLLATVGLALVGLAINRFAARSASSGSLFAFACAATSPGVGAVVGFALFLAYLFTAAAVPLAFANYAQVLVLEATGGTAPGGPLGVVVLTSACTTAAFWIAYRDIKLSTKAMLVLELVSMGLISLLAVMVLARGGASLDRPQLALGGTSFQGLRLGLVLAVFSYVGFESATALGDEARDPLRTIPRAVIVSVVVVGLFFVLLSYVMVAGFRGSATPLDKASAPLAVLAEGAGLRWLGPLISLGACASFFACCLASITAGARVLYAMARKGLLHPRLGDAHAENATPHVAVTLTAAIVLLSPAALVAAGAATLDAYAYLGTLATFGFLVAYVAIALALPLHRHGEAGSERRDWALAVGAVAFMLLPLVGSVYPSPPPPYDRLPYIFAGLMAAGGLWMWAASDRGLGIADDLDAEPD